MTATPGRVIALDLGEVRVGVAVSDPLGCTAQPSGFLARRPQASFLSAVKSLVDERNATRVVVGLPLKLSGLRGERAEDAEAVAEVLRKELGVPVELWDERFTTAQAERALREGAVGGRKRRVKVDAVAAAVLLQSYLDARTSSST